MGGSVTGGWVSGCLVSSCADCVGNGSVDSVWRVGADAASLMFCGCVPSVSDGCVVYSSVAASVVGAAVVETSVDSVGGWVCSVAAVPGGEPPGVQAHSVQINSEIMIANAFFM